MVWRCSDCTPFLFYLSECDSAHSELCLDASTSCPTCQTTPCFLRKLRLASDLDIQSQLDGDLHYTIYRRSHGHGSDSPAILANVSS